MCGLFIFLFAVRTGKCNELHELKSILFQFPVLLLKHLELYSICEVSLQLVLVILSTNFKQYMTPVTFLCNSHMETV
jgi:hypothetical protein